MADSILRLKVDSQEYDQKIKRAAEGIQQYAQKCREAGGTLQYLDDGVLEFVQSLGKMDTVATGTKQQLREMSNALTTLTQTYRGLTDEEKASPFGQELAKGIQQLTERAGAAKDAMMDVEQSIKNAASDTRMFDQLAQGASVMTAGFQGLTGAGKMLGIEMGNDVEVIAKLQAAMAVTNSLTTIQTALQKQSALMQGVQAAQTALATAAQTAFGAATGSATAAQAAFNAVANMNPYVALATAITAVAGAYLAWTSNANKAKKAQEALNTELDNTKNQLSQIDKDTDFSVGIAQAAGKSWKAIHELRLEAARTKLQLADMNYDKLAASGNASAEQMKQAAEMQKQAWDNVMKVLNEGTIHWAKEFYGGGKGSGSGGRNSTKSTSKEDDNFAADSIMAQEKEVQKLTDAWNRASGAMREGILKDLDAAKAKLEEMRNGTKAIEGGELGGVTVTGNKMVSVNKAFSESPLNFDSINTYISGVKDAIKNADLGSDLYNSLTEKLNDASTMTAVLQQAMASGVQGVDLTSAADEMKRKLLEGDINEDAWQEFIDKLNEKIENEDLKLVFDVDSKSIETVAKQQQKDAQAMAKDWQAAGTAIQAVGNAMQQIEDPAAKVLGTIAQAVATMALSYAQAAASPAVTGTGWGWIAFAATGVATMLSSIAAIKNATSGFANGGIVPGNSFSGDNLRTSDYGINSGELILNKAQQGNLASQLEGGGIGNLQLETKVGAEDLIFVLNNNASRRGFGEFIDD